jgi:hypothetical protein
MLDLPGRLVAAIQQVRTRAPHKDGCECGPTIIDDSCRARRATWVDARLAACVEAAVAEGYEQGVHEGWNDRDADVDHQVLAAFLAAAAQKETAK